MRVYIMTGANLDLCMDCSADEVWEEALYAGNPYLSLDAAMAAAERDVAVDLGDICANGDMDTEGWAWYDFGIQWAMRPWANPGLGGCPLREWRSTEAFDGTVYMVREYEVSE